MYVTFIQGKYTYFEKIQKKAFEDLKKWESTSVTFQFRRDFMKEVAFGTRGSIPTGRVAQQLEACQRSDTTDIGNLILPFYSLGNFWQMTATLSFSILSRKVKDIILDYLSGHNED